MLSVSLILLLILIPTCLYLFFQNNSMYIDIEMYKVKLDTQSSNYHKTLLELIDVVAKLEYCVFEKSMLEQDCENIKNRLVKNSMAVLNGIYYDDKSNEIVEFRNLIRLGELSD